MGRTIGDARAARAEHVQGAVGAVAVGAVEARVADAVADVVGARGRAGVVRADRELATGAVGIWWA